MCLEKIKESKVKRRFGYKIFYVDEKGKLYSYFAKQRIIISTKVWQGARWKTMEDVDSYSNLNKCFRDSSHLNKISVLLDRKRAMEISFMNSPFQLWKVELKYKKLLVGDWEGDRCALVDEIRLVEKIK